MEIRVKFSLFRVNQLHAPVFQNFCQLVVNHLHALLELGGISCLRSHGTVEVVQHRQQLLDEVLHHHIGQFLFFLTGTAAEILKICLQALHALRPLGQLHLQCLSLGSRILFSFSLNRSLIIPCLRLGFSPGSFLS